MDGPLADFDLAFYQMCNNRGWTLDITNLSDPKRRRFMTDNMVNGEQRAMARRIVDSTRWFLGLPVTTGAREGVELLMEHFDVMVCTKPLEANPTCRDDKYEWLKSNFPELAPNLMICPNKSWAHGDILLDDAIKPREIPHAVWNPVCFPTGFNGPDSEWAELPRWGWGDPIEQLLQLAEPPF